jgi:hemoglobin
VDDERLFDAVGGLPFFETLTARFYAGVEGDDVLRSLYPDRELAPARRRLMLFLAQYWGGPLTYTLERGHPRLRARHLGFWIGPEARDRWLHHMLAAVEASGASMEMRSRLTEYFVSAAAAMQNRPDDDAPSSGPDGAVR